MYLYLFIFFINKQIVHFLGNISPKGRSYEVEIGVFSALGFALLVIVVFVAVWCCKERTNNVNNNGVVRQSDISNHGHQSSVIGLIFVVSMKYRTLYIMHG